MRLDHCNRLEFFCVSLLLLSVVFSSRLVNAGLFPFYLYKGKRKKTKTHPTPLFVYPFKEVPCSVLYAKYQRFSTSLFLFILSNKRCVIAIPFNSQLSHWPMAANHFSLLHMKNICFMAKKQQHHQKNYTIKHFTILAFKANKFQTICAHTNTNWLGIKLRYSKKKIWTIEL